jgi:hypothetical protein
MKILAAALLSIVPAFAQLELLRLDPNGVEVPAGALIDAGTVAAGDIQDTRLRLRNRALASDTLRQLHTAGTGFTVENSPSLPIIVAPGGNVDFRVRFAPRAFGSYSATLNYNGRSVLLSGRSPEQAVVTIEQGEEQRVLQTSQTVDFGRVRRDESSRRRFGILNPTLSPVTIRQMFTDSEAFQGPLGLTLPVTLAPGESAGFEIEFNPPRAGVLRAILTVDGRQFPLEGFAIEYPFPGVQLEVPPLKSGEQQRITIRFSEPVRSTATGRLSLAFAPEVQGTPDDPAIIFVANSSRLMPVNVREGSTEIVHSFQTGTTAGNLTIRFEIDNRVYDISAALAPSPVVVSESRAIRSTSGIELRINGFDNTRSVGSLAFTFYDKSGRVVGAGPVRSDAASVFAQYFRNSTIGGLFALQALFPIAGNPADIERLDVELFNSVGSPPPIKISF